MTAKEYKKKSKETQDHFVSSIAAFHKHSLRQKMLESYDIGRKYSHLNVDEAAIIFNKYLKEVCGI